MKYINKALNLAIIILSIVFIIFILVSFVEPGMYNASSTGNRIKNYNEYDNLQYILKTYLSYYNDQNIDNLKKCIPITKRENNDIYLDISEKLVKDKINQIIINNIEYKFKDVYIIEYSFNTDYSRNVISNPENKKIIIKLNKLNNTFLVYYDSLIDEAKIGG